MNPRQQALQALDRRIRDLIALDGNWPRIPRDQAPARIADLTTELFHSLAQCEHFLPTDELRERAEPAREVFARSELIRRMQTWPRGFAGDFETIEYLVEGRNRAQHGSLAYSLEELVLCCPAAQQHRNKLRHQSRLVAELLDRANGSAPRILSIAAGGAQDLVGLVNHADQPFELVVNDLDQGALEAARERLAPLGERVSFVLGNALRVARILRKPGHFDLVLAGGLFDYLDDRAAICLLRAIDRLLAPGGCFFWTNMARGNPQRPWMEILGNWRLLERDRCEIESLADAAGIRRSRLELDREETGLTWLLRVGSATIADRVTGCRLPQRPTDWRAFEA